MAVKDGAATTTRRRAGRAYDVDEHENVVLDGRSTVMGDHRPVDDDQCLDEPLSTDRPRRPPSSSSSRRPAAARRRRRLPPFVVVVGRARPDARRSPVIEAVTTTVHSRRVPATVVVCTSNTQHTLNSSEHTSPIKPFPLYRLIPRDRFQGFSTATVTSEIFRFFPCLSLIHI